MSIASVEPAREPLAGRLPILDGPWNADVWELERPVRLATSGTTECVVATCSLPAGAAEGDRPQATDSLCTGHRRRRAKGSHEATLEQFIQNQATARVIGRSRGANTRKPTYPAIDFRLVDPRLADELRYVVSIKVNRNSWRDPRYVNTLLLAAIFLSRKYCAIHLNEMPAALERELHVPADKTNVDVMSNTARRDFGAALPGMLRTLESATPDPWDADIWHPTNLGIPTPPTSNFKSIRWSRVSCGWLREGLRLLTRERLQSGAVSWATACNYTRGGIAFSKFIEAEVGSIDPEDMSRPLFLDFVAWLRDDNGSTSDIVAARTLSRLLADMRDSDLIEGLPLRAFTLRGDIPDKALRKPKPFPDDMLEHFDELLRDDTAFPPDVQLMMRVFRAIGPRATEVLSMAPDVVTFVEGRGYTMSYYQTKIDHWRTVPLPPLVGEALVEQRKMVESTYGRDCPYLFPYFGPATRMNNLVHARSGFSAWPYWRFTELVWSVYQARGITSSAQTGETLAGPHLHRFRHSIATGLLNEGWSQYEVQKFLGQKSPTMMQAYAEIHDDNLRDKYMSYIDGAVDIAGKSQPILTAVEADTERLRAKMVRAELPNGFCVLPEKQNCDFLPSPCLSCAFFRTTPTFLPIHIRQRDDSLRELDVARADGRERAVQTHEQTIGRLNTIIDGLQPPAPEAA